MREISTLETQVVSGGIAPAVVAGVQLAAVVVGTVAAVVGAGAAAVQAWAAVQSIPTPAENSCKAPEKGRESSGTVTPAPAQQSLLVDDWNSPWIVRLGY